MTPRLEETIQTYRMVFGAGPNADMGHQVFTWLLERCGLFRRIDTEEQRVLHNWGVELLENMGLTQGTNYRAVVDVLMKFAIPEEALDGRSRQKG